MRGRRRAGRWVVAATVASCALAVVVVRAATLGGLTSSSLSATDVAGSPSTPTILGCDNFTGADTSSITGRAGTSAAACTARTWTAHTTARWSIASNQGRSAGVAPVVAPTAIATMNTSSSDATAQATFTNAPSLLGSQAGVIVSASAGATSYLAAVLEETLLGGVLGDSVSLRCTCSVVNLGSAPVTLSGTPVLRLTRSGAAVTVRIDGAIVLTYTLTAGQSSDLSGGRAGLWTSSDTITVDDFVVTTASP